MKKIIASLACLLVFAGASLGAQNKASLNIICNVAAAKVFLNGKEAGITTPNFSFLVPSGQYQIRVQKNGYKTFEDIVTVKGNPVTINVNLEKIGSETVIVVTPSPTPAPKTYNVKINSNVNNAEVYVNGNQTGKTPITLAVQEGNYSITVKANGYEDFNQVLKVDNNTTINANLQQSQVTYTVNNLINGAQIYINGKLIATANGKSISFQIAPGTYTLTVKLAGFIDFTTQITITGNQNISPSFQPMLATVTLVIPNNMISKEGRDSKESKNSKDKKYGDVQFYVDGDDVDERKSFTVTAGRHSLKLVSGYLTIETSFDFEAGRSYTIEPFAGLNIK